MGTYRRELYGITEGLDRDNYILATYLVSSTTRNYYKLGGEIAVEQTTGSWVPVPLETPEVMAGHGGKVVNAFEVPDYPYTPPEGKRTFVIEVAYPTINFTSQIPMLFSTVIGNISLVDLKLVDLKFPKSFVDGFPGPKCGIQGLRNYLSVPHRPLLNNMIKPCTGLSPQKSAELFYEVAVGGIDVVKDDELIANAPYSSIVDRVREFMKMEKRAFEETGEHTFYAVNITDKANKVLDNARAAIDAGANMLMLNSFTAGFGVLQVLAEEKDINLPIMSHSDFVGVLSGSEKSGMSLHLTLGKLLRMCGSDVVVMPTNYGKLPITRENVAKVVVNLQSPFYDLKPAMPMPSGGMTQGQVKVMMDDFGADIMIGAGAAVHAHPLGPRAGARAFRQAVDAVMEGRKLSEAAQECPELAAAVKAWGIEGEKEAGNYGLLQ